MIKEFQFGTTCDGVQVKEYILSNGTVNVKVLNYGGIIRAIEVPNKNGKLVDVVLGFNTLADYENDTTYIGAIVGRCANRIAKGKFILDNKEYTLFINNGENHLHGGKIGFNKKVWESEIVGNKLKLSYISKDMEEGYPGNLIVTVTYSLSDDNELKLEYSAVSDKKTVINLTNHTYFNLNGDGLISDEVLSINADTFTVNDKNSLPTGEIKSVKDTPMDFTYPHRIGDKINEDYNQLVWGNGYDHNYCINGNGLREMACAFDETSGIKLTAYTTMPGVQLYTANYLEGIKGKGSNMARTAFCLESQYYPDSLSNVNFPQPVFDKDEEYYHTTSFKFSLI
ncbi:MAG: aldose epimerase family protein [Oscillospiraceae bacterium]